jgi:hypothetical protein
MNAGNKLDQKICTEVMGWRRHPDYPNQIGVRKEFSNFEVFMDQGSVPKFSTDQEAHLILLDFLRQDYGFQYHRDTKEGVLVNKQTEAVFVVKADTEELALCLAALKAKGVEV